MHRFGHLQRDLPAGCILLMLLALKTLVDVMARYLPDSVARPIQKAWVERRVGFRGEGIAIRLKGDFLPELRQASTWPFLVPLMEGIASIIMNEEASQGPNGALGDLLEMG